MKKQDKSMKAIEKNAFYQDEGDVLIGKNVMDEYSITFDSRNSSLTINP